MSAAGSLGVYLHVPFCTERCSYCAFYTLRGGPRDLERYLRAMAIDLRSAADSGRAVDTIYFGGGTPSLLPPAAVTRLLTEVRSTFQVATDAEITLEANPEEMVPGLADALAVAGVNRISLGVQSFHDEVLAAVGRRHDHAAVTQAVAAVRGAGIANLSLDLIAGLPKSDRDRFRADLAAAVALAPEHVSVYMLETDKPTPLTQAAGRGEVRLPDEDAVVEMFRDACETLAGAGLHAYEISNFAQPGRESRHNRKYWRGEPVLGVGPSAWSTRAGERERRVSSLGGYLLRLEQGQSPLDEITRLGNDEAAGEALYLGLRETRGVSLRECSRRYGVDLVARYRDALGRLEGAGLLAWDRAADTIRLTGRGIPLANEVFAEFVEGAA